MLLRPPLAAMIDEACVAFSGTSRALHSTMREQHPHETMASITAASAWTSTRYLASTCRVRGFIETAAARCRSPQASASGRERLSE